MSRLGLKKKPAPRITKPVASRSVEKIDIAPISVSKSEHKFTPRQALFMDHWMVSRNASDAATKAGYGKKSAYSMGSQLLSNIKIRAELDRRIGKQADRFEVTADRVVREVAKIAFADMGRFLGPDGLPLTDFSKLDPDDTAAIHGITVEEFKDGRSDKREVRRFKFTLHDKVKGLDLLMQKLGLKIEKHEHDHKGSLSILGLMLREIDQESRAKTIEHQK